VNIFDKGERRTDFSVDDVLIAIINIPELSRELTAIQVHSSISKTENYSQGKNMFSNKQRIQIVHDLQEYFEEEMELEVGQFDVEFLLDHLIKTIGPAFYNQGLADAKAVIDRRLLDITDELFEIERQSNY
jgi:uncharacterized protein (DUF2164 family)